MVRTVNWKFDGLNQRLKDGVKLLADWCETGLTHSGGLVHHLLRRKRHPYATAVVSRGELYQGDFKPEINFDPSKADVQAVLIFDGARIEGARVIDISRNGNDWNGVFDER